MSDDHVSVSPVLLVFPRVSLCPYLFFLFLFPFSSIRFSCVKSITLFIYTQCFPVSGVQCRSSFHVSVITPFLFFIKNCLFWIWSSSPTSTRYLLLCELWQNTGHKKYVRGCGQAVLFIAGWSEVGEICGGFPWAFQPGELARWYSWLCVSSWDWTMIRSAAISPRVIFIFFPLIWLINLILYLNGFDFEVKENSKSPRLAPSGTSHVSPAHPMPRTPTYLTNGSDHLPNPRYPLSSTHFLPSPQPRTIGHSEVKPARNQARRLLQWLVLGWQQLTPSHQPKWSEYEGKSLGSSPWVCCSAVSSLCCNGSPSCLFHQGPLSSLLQLGAQNGYRPGGLPSSAGVSLEASLSAHPPSPHRMLCGAWTRLPRGGTSPCYLLPCELWRLDCVCESIYCFLVSSSLCPCFGNSVQKMSYSTRYRITMKTFSEHRYSSNKFRLFLSISQVYLNVTFYNAIGKLSKQFVFLLWPDKTSSLNLGWSRLRLRRGFIWLPCTCPKGCLGDEVFGGD